MTIRRPRTPEQMDTIAEADRAKHDNFMMGVISGDITPVSTEDSAIIPEFSAGLLDKTVNVAFEDITQDMESDRG